MWNSPVLIQAGWFLVLVGRCLGVEPSDDLSSFSESSWSSPGGVSIGMTGTEVESVSGISSGLSMPGSSTEGTGSNKGTGYSSSEDEESEEEEASWEELEVLMVT